MPDLNWNDLRYVLALARAQAIAPAARRLGVNETTVARRLAAAEASLGALLFDRYNGGLQPTAMGRSAIDRAEQVELEIEKLKAAAAIEGTVSGRVRITSIPLIVNRVLVPGLPRLRSAFPLLQIEAIAEPRNVSLTRRDADIALRLSRPQREPKVIARRIGVMAYSVYGALDADPNLPWITYDDRMETLPHVVWIDNAIKREARGPAALRVNDSEVALHAIRAGVGRSLLPRMIGEADPALACLSGTVAVLARELWLLVHPDIRNLARIKAVASWLSDIVSPCS